MPEGDRRRWRVLALLASAELLGMSLWFVGNAIAPSLRARWLLSGGEIGWLTTAVQLGFVAGTALAAMLNLADIFPSRFYFAASALLAALANAAFGAAPSFAAALGWRFATGACLAGVYPPAMKMAATWFRQGRGLAIGTIVAALTVGKATPYLLHALPAATPAEVVLAASGAAALAAALVGFGYRDGPYPFVRRPFSWRLAGSVARHRETRLATAGYLGHMWELYAMWTWVPAYLTASAIASGSGVGSRALDLAGFAVIGVGGLGCLWGGWAAGRIGYRAVVIRAMLASGACALAAGPAFRAPFPLVFALTLVWGFFVVADSAQFSALVTEVAPPHAVGTALTLQTSIGFLLTIVTIQLVPALVSVAGWRWTVGVLALGPAAGIAAIRRLGPAHDTGAAGRAAG
ncbi:MAG: MFS transporter [Bacillota bacterium]